MHPTWIARVTCVHNGGQRRKSIGVIALYLPSFYVSTL